MPPSEDSSPSRNPLFASAVTQFCGSNIVTMLGGTKQALLCSDLAAQGAHTSHVPTRGPGERTPNSDK